MKVEKIDYIWAVLAFIAVGITHYNGILLYGIVGIFLTFAALMFYHISVVRKQQQNTAAVYAKITGYHFEKGVTPHYYPMVSFETEDGREINTIYSLAEKSERYEIDSEEMICYSLDDPMVFFFSNRQDEFVNGYYKLMIFSVIAAVAAFVAAQILAG